MQSPELLKGSLQTVILRLLEAQGRMYGYEITQRVKELTQGQIALTEGALYPALHKLEAEGLLTSEVEYIGKRPRKYYKLTPEGGVKARAKVQEHLAFLDLMRGLLGPSPTTFAPVLVKCLTLMLLLCTA